MYSSLVSLKGSQACQTSSIYFRRPEKVFQYSSHAVQTTPRNGVMKKETNSSLHSVIEVLLMTTDCRLSRDDD